MTKLADPSPIILPVIVALSPEQISETSAVTDASEGHVLSVGQL